MNTNTAPIVLTVNAAFMLILSAAQHRLILRKYLVHPGRPLLKILRGLESPTFRDRYGPITDCLPTTPLDDRQLARDAHTASRGLADTPVASGELTTIDSRRGTVRLEYELYSNPYRVFVLLIPHRRLVLGRWSGPNGTGRARKHGRPVSCDRHSRNLAKELITAMAPTAAGR